jgi:hypothetical protein
VKERLKARADLRWVQAVTRRENLPCLRKTLLHNLGKKASNLRMVQRDLARLADLGLIEKVGGRKDAYYRPVGNLEEDDSPSQLPRRAGA